MRRRFCLLLTASIAGWAVPASAAAPEADRDIFANHVLSFLATLPNEQGTASAMVTEIRQLDIKNGSLTPSDVSSFVTESRAYKLDKIAFRPTDIDVFLMARESAGRCFGALFARFFPAGNKVAVQYSKIADYVCPQMVGTPPALGGN